MIRVQQHPSFEKWYQIYAFGMLLEEIGSKRKAVRAGRKVAKEWGAGFFLLDNVPIET